jgi:organic hydroperoxide reductase OsmC/OhrA
MTSPDDASGGAPSHTYAARVAWSGSTAEGYDAYDRRHAGQVGGAGGAEGRHGSFTVGLSSDAAFLGDPALPNPEQLLVLAAASCQLLSFLAVAARARLDVLSYTDDAAACMPVSTRPVGLSGITLRPQIVVADRRVDRDASVTLAQVERLCEVAHRECYVANSLQTPIEVVPTVVLVPAQQELPG